MWHLYKNNMRLIKYNCFLLRWTVGEAKHYMEGGSLSLYVGGNEITNFIPEFCGKGT